LTSAAGDEPVRVLRVAVAGASGFVGRALLALLAERCAVVALSRRPPDSKRAPSGVAIPVGAPPAPGVVWRRCDLFSLLDTEAALAGCDVAIYLVHSMLPAARLVQGRFEDLDLLLADDFARAAARAGVRRIIYLGGLVPEGDPRDTALSAHLRSRLEVERALASHGAAVTAVRAGLVVGRGGSSLDIMLRLVARLPLMVCPAWTGTRTQPIALDDVVAILVHCVEDEATAGRVCEVGGPDVLSYRDMMRETARVLGLRRLFVPVPFFTPQLSRLWVTLVAGAPWQLVAPLVESLRHPMVVRDGWLQRRMQRPGTPFARALENVVRADAPASPSTACSVQRLPLPARFAANDLAHEYVRWLPRLLRPFIAVDFDGSRCAIRWRGVAQPLLALSLRADGSDRALFAVTGGLLAGARVGTPRLEFRVVDEGTCALAALQDFHPRLPWWLYARTQARTHAFVMARFGRHLARIAADSRLRGC
jgi:uncharacterized protein YbjT (DUF2867 family)